MKIEKITIENCGYVFCKSTFYSVHDLMSENRKYTFFKGLNVLPGEIDSGNFAVSYLLSMYESIDQTTLFLPLNASVNGQMMSLEELNGYCCYVDQTNPLFVGTVRDQILCALQSHHLSIPFEQIVERFHLNADRLDRPVTAVGNEKFKAMAAIGFCQQRQVFCFPWFSKMRFNALKSQLNDLFEILKSLNAVIILPIGES